MNRFERYKNHGFHNKKKTVVKPHEITRSGLAYTPADMERMTAQGIPIQSRDITGRYYDGTADCSFGDITSDMVKTNDVNDMWEEHQTILAKHKAAYNQHKKSVKPQT